MILPNQYHFASRVVFCLSAKILANLCIWRIDVWFLVLFGDKDETECIA